MHISRLIRVHEEEEFLTWGSTQNLFGTSIKLNVSRCRACVHACVRALMRACGCVRAHTHGMAAADLQIAIHV